MMRARIGQFFGVVAQVLFVLLVGLPSSAWGQGVALTAVGPVNRSMGGAATACPLDAAGTIHWNPAAISGLPASEMTMGMELILPSSELASRVNAGALGQGFPPIDLSGVTRSEPGVTPVPYMAFVRKSSDSPWSYGLGLYGIGGFSVNYPASTTNPILTPHPPVGLGMGRISASLELMQIAPTLSYALSPGLSIGFAPTVTLGRLIADPLFLASPDDANGDGFANYPSGAGTRYHWGGGFQVGVYYITDRDCHFVASLKSPQWMEEIRWKTADEVGLPRTATFKLDYPLIVSLGAAYTGWENYVIACDVRYFDYANTEGFREAGFGPDGALRGLGWNSVLGVSAGIQRRLGERASVRLGYSFGENPVACAVSAFNVASPLIVQHVLYLGASYDVSDNWTFSVAYMHAFENRVSGPICTGLGPIPGTSVTSIASADVINAGLTARF